jgi:hypothetical protein
MQNQENQLVEDQINSQLETPVSDFVPPSQSSQRKFNKMLVIILSLILFLAVLFISIYLHFRAKLSDQWLEGSNKTSVDSVLATPTPAISMVPLSIFTDKYAFGKQIEQEFSKIVQDYAGQVILNQDASVWWIADNGFNIINDGEIGLDYLYFNCEEDSTGEVSDRIADRLSKSIYYVMTTAGFSLNQANSSKSIADDQFYDYVQAYEKDNLKCTFVASPDCGGSLGEDTMHYDFSFTCTDSFEKNYREQLPFLKDLNIAKAIIHVSKRVGDYAMVNVNYRRTGHYVIAQLVNGIWVELSAGQDIPNCQIMEKYQVPQEIYGECYDEESLSAADFPESMKRALQDFKKANQDSTLELYYFEGAMLDGNLALVQDNKILQGSAIVNGVKVSFQLGVDGMGGECETRECIGFTNNQGLEFAGVILPNGCNITFAGENYGNSSFGITDESICNSNEKLVDLFSKLKKL